MAANDPQMLGLLVLAIPAVVYYFFVNKDVNKSLLYLVAFFGSLFVVKALNIGAVIGSLSATIVSYLSVIIATSLALYLAGDKLDLKNVGWLAGVVIAGQLIFPAMLSSAAMGFI